MATRVERIQYGEVEERTRGGSGPAWAWSPPTLRRSFRTLLALALLVPAPLARAEPQPLRVDLPVDLAVTAGALAVWGGTGVAKGRLAPTTCRICETTAVDAWARDQLLWEDTTAAEKGANLLAYYVLPISAATYILAASRANGGTPEQGFTDLLVVTEAVALAGSVSQLVKLAVGRERPYVHHRNFSDPDRRPAYDDNLSFYSGHTSLAFSLATATGTVAYVRGEPGAPWVLGVGLAAGVAVGWLSVADDRHWLTDVLAGAVLGSVIGWGVPWVFHRPGQPADTTGAANRAAPPQLPIGLILVF